MLRAPGATEASKTSDNVTSCPIYGIISLMSEQIVNIAVYKFVSLTDLKQRRENLRRLCQRARLRGTILLASEGFNLFLAGEAAGVERLLDELAGDSEIGPLNVKRSYTEYQPFNRMLVKIKKEIIAFGVEGIAPGESASKKISSIELKRWLDEGRDFTLLDTRNDYEIKLGTFDRAHEMNIDHFREFPASVENFPGEWRTKPVVMFCTGGIRCEKAGPLMEQHGFEDVRQLDGGILKYFEEVGQEHYRGDCFVFDQRVAVDAALRESDAAQCYVCQAILTPEEQHSSRYVPSESCPHCYQSPIDELTETLRQRHQQLREITNPLPGSQPYDNLRPIYVPARCNGMLIAEFLTAAVPAHPEAWWLEEIYQGHVLKSGQPAEASRSVKPGEHYEHLTPGIVEPDVDGAIEILHEDAALVVVNKPAPLPMHPCGRFNRNTLARLLAPVYQPEQLRPAHRLDANTSGVVVLTRSRRMAQRLQPQFGEGKVEKIYLARVHGHPQADQFDCHARLAEGKSTAGVRQLCENGLQAETRFRVLKRFEDGTSLLSVQPITGRTNQIRLHLWSLNLPIVGDPTYQSNTQPVHRQTLAIDDGPMCLHAQRVQFIHPGLEEQVTFEAAAPDWADGLSDSIATLAKK